MVIKRIKIFLAALLKDYCELMILYMWFGIFICVALKIQCSCVFYCQYKFMTFETCILKERVRKNIAVSRNSQQSLPLLWKHLSFSGGEKKRSAHLFHLSFHFWNMIRWIFLEEYVFSVRAGCWNSSGFICIYTWCLCKSLGTRLFKREE